MPIQAPQAPAFATDLSSDQRVGGSSPSERANLSVIYSARVRAADS